MIILLGFAFLAGIVTILSPCILPVLPIVLSGGIGKSKDKPLGIILGFILSFTFFTLFLSTLVKFFNLPSTLLRTVSVFVIFFFGMSLLFPRFQLLMESAFRKTAGFSPGQGDKSGIGGGFVVGLSLGLLWTPCVGPIIASVITLAASSTVTVETALITLFYSAGTAIPMLMIMYGGRTLLSKAPFLLRNSLSIQRIFGVVMMVLAIGIFFNADQIFQAYILNAFPSYGANLTKIENNSAVRQQLQGLKSGKSSPIVNAAPEFQPNGTWLNSSPLTLSSLKGKVVLVDFWTYSCVNCIRTLPYVTGWYKKYNDDGFVVVGIHTPEFEFEKKKENVAQAIKRFGITYPVVMDNDYGNWNAYSNSYWPAKYLIDANGQIRYTHFGEGEYAQTETKIRDLLKEKGSKDLGTSPASSPANFTGDRITPETYLGQTRAQTESDTPDNLPLDYYYLSGTWGRSGEYVTSSDKSALTLHFSGREVNLVMSPQKAGTVLHIFLNGKPIEDKDKGKDVLNGKVVLDTDRLYNLVELQEYGSSDTVRIEFGGEVKCYAFTFG